jgi:acid phosphatase (class A)
MTRQLLSHRRWFAAAGIVIVGLTAAKAAGPYLPAFDPIAQVPPPPPPHSPGDVADRDAAFRIYSSRTDDEMVTARAEHRVTLEAFAEAIGPVYEEGKFPKLEKLFEGVGTEVKAAVDQSRDHWKRLRPHIADPARFKKPGDPEKTWAYPSAHATQGICFALLLAEIFPDRRDAILRKGHEIGWVRIQAGVQTPLDNQAGEILGQALAKAYMREPAFLQDLAAVNAQVADLSQ